MADNFKRQRNAWFREHPYCYFCGCELVLLNFTGRTKNVPPNAATIDHLRPRGHPDRHEPNPFNIWRRVLACWSCNNRRGREFLATRSLEEIWRATGQWTRMAYQSGALPGEVEPDVRQEQKRTRKPAVLGDRRYRNHPIIVDDHRGRFEALLDRACLK